MWSWLRPVCASVLLYIFVKETFHQRYYVEAWLSDVDILLDQLRDSKDSIGTAVDTLIEENDFSELLYHTITRTHEMFPALGGFISNVLIKVAQKRPWRDDSSLWPHFVRTSVATAPHSYLVSFHCSKTLAVFCISKLKKCSKCAKAWKVCAKTFLSFFI